ncbi:MAG: 2-C-methyl-D-erythritol 2,4-cyclodiphosphate synthase [Clostridia bacterium]|nr:2-C-methyl-D-erythritol 2,4-cyclodiphosphate synthase [Clostridia bacterium]
MTRILGILLCAGSSNRMGFCKLTTPLFGKTAIERSADALMSGGVTSLVCVVNENTLPTALSLPYEKTVVFGGKRRQDSVLCGLLAQEGDLAVIHDAARCLVSPELVRRTIQSALKNGSGVAALPLHDTLARSGKPVSYLSREGLWQIQTPQSFDYARILAAYRKATADFTDDGSVFAASGNEVVFVEGELPNRKLTTLADWNWAKELLCREKRYGTGFDTHRLVEGRKLLLGGVDIPFSKGLLGHSDADVLLHAVMDALLGACALGDIGRHFPDTDPAYSGADSRKLLRACVDLVQKRDMRIINIDSVIICQEPKLSPHIERMRENIARDCEVEVSAISVKATTTEGMNDEGRGNCISAQAIACVGRTN